MIDAECMLDTQLLQIWSWESKSDALARSVYFHQWHCDHLGPSVERIIPKAFILVTLKLSAKGFVMKMMAADTLMKKKPGEYQWHGGFQRSEHLVDGRLVYR